MSRQVRAEQLFLTDATILLLHGEIFFQYVRILLSLSIKRLSLWLQHLDSDQLFSLLSEENCGFRVSLPPLNGSEWL